MKKQAILIFCLVTILLQFKANAQDSKKYKEMSAELEQSIWGTKDPLFESNTIPEEYKNESAVILAQKHTIATDSKRKTGIFGLPARNYIDKKVWKTFRQKIVINDQVSLNDFSEISFAKLDSKRFGLMGGKDMSFTFIGIRLIKKDGSITKVPIDESAVTLKETKDGKKNKIAIPNLAIGDIVDYYIASYEQVGTGTNTNYYSDSPDLLTFVLTDDYPVLNYGIYMVLDKRIAAEYQCMNGAPDFKITKQDEDNILEIRAKNLIKTKDLIWTSNYRQLPIIRIRYVFGNLHYGEFMVQKGDIRKNADNSKRIEKSIQDLLSNNFLSVYNTDYTLQSMRRDLDDIKNAFKKNRPAVLNSTDSLAYICYYLGRLYSFYGSAFSLKDDLSDADRGMNLGQQLLQALRMRSVFENGIKIDCEFIDVTSRNSVTRKNLFEEGDLSLLLRINAPKPVYLYLGNGLYNYGEVPPSLEDGDGAYFSIKPVKSLFKVTGYTVDNEGSVKVPALTAEQHSQKSSLTISLDEKDNQLLNIKRNTKAKGQTRRFFQASLLLPEDVIKAERGYLGLTTDLVETYKDLGKAQRKSVDEFTTILKKARDTEKEKYEDEIYKEFEQKAKELKSFKVLNMGLHHHNNVFEMEEEFSMNSWIKKAGNNYIIEAGKFIGGQFEIKADQRERKLDVYMAHARSYSYQIEFIIPDGYTVEGLDKLNKKVENETGGFVSTATVNGNKLLINTNKYYNHIVEKAENWSKLTAFVDAAFEFGKERILLKKK